MLAVRTNMKLEGPVFSMLLAEGKALCCVSDGLLQAGLTLGLLVNFENYFRMHMAIWTVSGIYKGKVLQDHIKMNCEPQTPSL